jgi:hypothetical protein
MVSNLVAPRFMAASSRVLSNFLSLAETISVTMVVIKENCPKTTSQNPGLNKAISRPKFCSKNKPRVLDKSRMEIPRITPGITRGASIRKKRTCLKANSSCSNKKAPIVPTIVENIETKKATLKLTHMLSRLIWSWKIPVLSMEVPVNQSRVNPFHGSAGNMESLNASTQVIARGAKRNTKNRII